MIKKHPESLRIHYREFYEKKASKFLHQPFSLQAQEKVYWWRKIKDLTYNFLESLNATLLLDVGCAEGYHVVTPVAQNKVKLAVGLDISYPFCYKGSIISQKLKVQNRTLFMTADASERIPFRSNTFDVVLCFETLEHIPDYYRAIRELHRVSKDIVIVSIPLEKTYLPYCFKLRRRNPSHINAFSLRKVTAVLEQVGLGIKEVRGVEFLPITHLFGSRMISPTSLIGKFMLSIENLLETILPRALARDVWIVTMKSKNRRRTHSSEDMPDLFDRIVCPHDEAKLKSSDRSFICPSCGREFILIDNVLSEKSLIQKISLEKSAFVHSSELPTSYAAKETPINCLSVDYDQQKF
jgi:ubiquinone/menaquinone biosynthesis C-methylase UbiE